MHNAEAANAGQDTHMAYLSEVASLALAAAVRLTSHRGSFGQSGLFGISETLTFAETNACRPKGCSAKRRWAS